MIVSQMLAAVIATAQPTLAVSDLTFLAGAWRGELGPMVVEETWLPPLGGNLTGVFRMAGSDAVQLVEIMTIAEEERDGREVLIYRLRHFDAALTPWAAEANGPIEAEVVLLGERHLRFEVLGEHGDLDAIEYRVQDGVLSASVMFRGGREPFELTMRRAEP